MQEQNYLGRLFSRELLVFGIIYLPVYLLGRGNHFQCSNIGTQSVQELFFCDSIRSTVYSNDLVKFFWLRCTARKKLGIYDVHTCTMLHR